MQPGRRNRGKRGCTVRRCPRGEVRREMGPCGSCGKSVGPAQATSDYTVDGVRRVCVGASLRRCCSLLRVTANGAHGAIKDCVESGYAVTPSKNVRAASGTYTGDIIPPKQREISGENIIGIKSYASITEPHCVCMCGVDSQFGLGHDSEIRELPGAPETVHRKAPVKLTTAQTRRHATQLREAQKHPVDFAGHFVMASWGCVMAAAIDARTGAVTMLPSTVSDWPLDVAEPLSYRKDSRLLVIRGSRSEKGNGTYYYDFDGKAFHPLKANEE